MLALGKCLEEHFRKDMYKSKRKKVEMLWHGHFDSEVADIVRFAPSSCNMQPWKVMSEEDCIVIYRITDVNSIMPINKRPFYNTIDMGIFLCILEILLIKKGYSFKRVLVEEKWDNCKDVKVAEYKIK